MLMVTGLIARGEIHATGCPMGISESERERLHLVKRYRAR